MSCYIFQHAASVVSSTLYHIHTTSFIWHGTSFLLPTSSNLTFGEQGSSQSLLLYMTFFWQKDSTKNFSSNNRKAVSSAKICNIFLYLQGLSLDPVADRVQRDCLQLFCSFISSHQFSFRIKHFCWRQKVYILASCSRISVNCSCTRLQLTQEICKLLS